MATIACPVSSRIVLSPLPVSAWWREECGRCAFKRAARAKEAGVDLAGYIASIEAKVTKWVSGAEVRVRLEDEQSLLGILKSKEILSWAATGSTSSHVKKFESRAETERKIFGIPPDAPPDDRPIYGYLGGSRETDPLTQFGPIVLGLDDAVHAQATFTLGDSHDATITAPVFSPAPLLAPSIDAVSNMMDNALDADRLADLCTNGYGYAEVQLRGPVPASLIRRVIYTAGLQPTISGAAGLRTAGLVPICVAHDDPGPR